VHPRQPPLEPEIEAIWIAAVEDAGLAADDCLLYLLDGSKSETDYSGWHFAHGILIPEGEDLGPTLNELLPEMNSEECIDAVRIVVWRDRTIEGLAGLIRHELEHALQDAAHGQKLEELYRLAMYVLAVRVGGLPGGGLLYTVIPNEFDANAAAAMFVRDRYGSGRIIELLEADDEHIAQDRALWRSLTPPAPVEGLPERLLAFFITHRDLCEAYARSQNFRFDQLLSNHWPGAGAEWRRLVDEGGLALPR
jgi:hypothetical protein